MKSLNRKQKIIVSITGIFIVLLALVGLTYAYFLTQITGNGNPKSISVTTANLRLVYADEDDQYVIGEDEIIEPNTTFEPKTFTVTNTGNGKVDEYAVILDNVSITYANTTDKVTEGDVTTLGSTTEGKENDFTLVITCKNQDDEPCNGYNAELLETSGILLTNSIEVDEVHTYTATLTYNDTGHNQSADMNKRYNGRFNIIDTKDTIDIGGTVSNYAKGDYVQTNSTERKSVIYSDGTYKIMGLEAGQHRIRVFDKTGTTTKLDKTINIVKGSTAGVSGTTITITPESRLATINIKSNDIEVGEIKDFERPKNLLKDAILARANSGISGASVYGQPLTTLGDVASYSDKRLASIEDDDGNTSYYFRGNVNDNYVRFNNMCWRIVRIEGDGSVKLILENKNSKYCTGYEFNAAQIGKGIYGYKEDLNGTVLADYGKINGAEDTNCETIKCKMETWYSNNFSKVDSLVKSAKNCIGDTTSLYGVDVDSFYTIDNDNLDSYDYFALYKTAKRMIEKNINLKCDGIYSDSSKTTLITADEVVLSGVSSYPGNYGTGSGQNTYMWSNNSLSKWYTLSPSVIVGDKTFVYYILNDQWASTGDNDGTGLARTGASVDYDDAQIRPVISLIPGVTITDGTGVIGDPYIIG